MFLWSRSIPQLPTVAGTAPLLNQGLAWSMSGPLPMPLRRYSLSSQFLRKLIPYHNGRVYFSAINSVSSGGDQWTNISRTSTLVEGNVYRVICIYGTVTFVYCLPSDSTEQVIYFPNRSDYAYRSIVIKGTNLYRLKYQDTGSSSTIALSDSNCKLYRLDT